MNEILDKRATIKALDSQIAEKILEYKRKRKRWQWTASSFKIGAVVIGGIASILLGWKEPGTEQILPNLALCLTVALTAIGTLDAFYDSKSMWILYSVALRRLDLLKIRLAGITPILDGPVGACPPPSSEEDRRIAIAQLGKIQGEFDGILANVIEGWQSIRSEPDSK